MVRWNYIRNTLLTFHDVETLKIHCNVDSMKWGNIKAILCRLWTLGNIGHYLKAPGATRTSVFPILSERSHFNDCPYGLNNSSLDFAPGFELWLLRNCLTSNSLPVHFVLIRFTYILSHSHCFQDFELLLLSLLTTPNLCVSSSTPLLWWRVVVACFFAHETRSLSCHECHSYWSDFTFTVLLIKKEERIFKTEISHLHYPTFVSISTLLPRVTRKYNVNNSIIFPIPCPNRPTP